MSRPSPVGEEPFIGDHDLLLKTFDLARRGMGAPGGNPLVGAVIARLSPGGSFEILATGYHRGKGHPHAEAEAIRVLLERPDLPPEGPAREAFMAELCLYVNLEPCCHQGTTPPCADLIVRTGIGRVVWAVDDINPEAHGAAGRLRAAGIAVRENAFPIPARDLNAVHFYYQTRRRAMLALKLAASLDGKIATPLGGSQWLTSPRARGLAHTLRQRYDAVVVGVGTVLADDPRLTVREEELRRYWHTGVPFTPRNPAVVVLDPELQTPPTARLFQAEDRPVYIATTGEREAAARGYPPNARLITLPPVGEAMSIGRLKEIMPAHGIFSLLMEGGAESARLALAQGAVDKLYHFAAPLIIGEGGKDPYRIPAPPELEQAVRLIYPQVEPLQGEALIYGYLTFDPRTEDTLPQGG